MCCERRWLWVSFSVIFQYSVNRCRFKDESFKLSDCYVCRRQEEQTFDMPKEVQGCEVGMLTFTYER